MSIDQKHPLYSKVVPDWEMMGDTFKGERIIKEAGLRYLSATPGQIIDGLNDGQMGMKNYLSYKSRARFPDFVSTAVEALLGIMHHKPANIELPDKMKPLLQKATVKGESLQQLLRRINEHQLITGRVSLLADVENGANAGALPYIALYNAADLINWDDGAREELILQTLNLVVLNESEYEREPDFSWDFKNKFRILILGDVDKNEASGVYRMGEISGEKDGLEFSDASLITPSIAGRTLEKLPFVIINTKDLLADPDDPPLLGLANLALGVYRGEADYRQTLFMQGQDTFVIIGGGDTDNIRVGAGAVISVTEGGDAKYVGVQSQGLSEMRRALENDRAEAAEMGGKLLDTRGKNAESGDALRIRVSARTASLNQIVQTGAEGLSDILKIMAEWIGEDPDKVLLEPNSDFADDEIDGDTLLKWVQAKSMGAPLSNKSIHERLRDKDLTSMSFDEEMSAIKSELDTSVKDDNDEE